MIAIDRLGTGRVLSELAAAGAGRHERLVDRLATAPRCPLTRYLMGCDEWDHDRPAIATRHFMIAYHAEPRLGSAALLAFAGLVYHSRPDRSILAALEQAWTEFRRPPFDLSAIERELLDTFSAPPPPGDPVRAEYARFWRLPIGRLRDELGAAWRTTGVS